MFVLIFLVLAIRTSWFQTWLAQQASAYYSKEFGTKVYIEEVDINLFDQADIKGVYLEDIKKDTFLYTKAIHIDIADWSLRDEFVDISNATLDEGHIHMKVYEGDSTLNFQHIVDYFESDSEDTTSSKFKVKVESFNLNDMHFVFDDQNADSTKGMDFSHIDLMHLSGGFSNFELFGEDIGVTLDDLEFIGSSGLTLSNLYTDVKFNSKGVTLNNLKIGLNRTYLAAEYLQFKTPNGGEDWGDFVNKVQINSKFKKSVLYIQDLSYFVHDIWGMEGRIDINQLTTSGAVSGMNIKELDLDLLDTTKIKGSFIIPKLGDINSTLFQENIALFRTSISDIRKMRLDRILDASGIKTLEKTLNQYAAADVVELTDGSMIGYITDFVVDGKLTSGIGNVDLDRGLKFKMIDDLYYYSSSENDEKGNIIVENLNMGAISGTDILDMVSGTIHLKGRGFNEKNLDVEFDGDLHQVGIYGYEYSGIYVKNGHFTNNKFVGQITVDDDHLALLYDGSVDLKGQMHFQFDVRIDSAALDELTGKNKEIHQQLVSKIKVDITGTDINKFYGKLELDDFNYNDGKVALQMDKLTLDVSRNEENDTIKLRSPYIDFDLYGKYDLNDVGHAVVEQFSYVMSNLIKVDYKTEMKDYNEHYELSVNLKNVNPLMKFVDENIFIGENTEVKSEYNYADKSFILDVNAYELGYQGIKFKEVKIENHMYSEKVNLAYMADYVQVTDSFAVSDMSLESYIQDNKSTNLFAWEGIDKSEPALFAFETSILEDQSILTAFRPSFFYLKGHKYDVERQSEVLVHEKEIAIRGMKISHGSQYVGLDGTISQNPNEWLNFQVHDFNLADLNDIIGDVVILDGILNLQGRIAGLYEDVKMEAQSSIDGFALNEYEVGEVALTARYNNEIKSIALNGDLRRNKARTFTFKGNYFLDREKENIDITANFTQTDISFLSAFEDPELYTNIQGMLDGKLLIKGELDNPIITGALDVVNARVKVPMFNVFFGAGGKIKFSDGEIIADHLRVLDQEGNKADAQLQIYHYDWADWVYNVNLDMDVPGLSDKFLAMNTYYKEGDYYYGKAYVSGYVAISGFGDQTEIEVNVKTKEGTDLVLPMYGSGELSENSFIIFDEDYFKPDSLKQNSNEDLQNVKRYGLTMNMEFDVTRAAQVKIVFDPVLEDQIVSRGVGHLAINIDDFGDMKMFGEYVIKNGRYDMRIKQVVDETFKLKEGGTVSWTGNSEDANINLAAQFERNTSLQPIIPPETGANRGKELVLGELRMKHTLMSPKLEFDILAPNTDQLGETALMEVRADGDELNKQFFSLLLFKSFIPRYGTTGGNNAMALLESQVNALLSGMSENYNIQAGISDESKTIGFETKITDQITISTAVGVANNDGSEGSGDFVGDVNVEYRLNDDGTFTMNFFNESNTSASAESGKYTQGVSLHYQETFHTTKQFKLLQTFLNIFRKKENRVDVKSGNTGRRVKVPPIETDSTGTN
ncbi:translocation/assembly module TamB [Paracrocinitomix mangrovi]|uniref:translocation/assembly module TamB domain-containing protein n=1 Tax=Paracrocinitomix mangrovi TaxID=2862509 RepID=UPI001C8DB558|nr:translocation/assembly module TamB domain-containing protein [Paracrocinitomix mangrovi]UKN02625.1 translocation/assembly module TamB [Paracrocinitomix mangrovi]